MDGFHVGRATEYNISPTRQLIGCDCQIWTAFSPNAPSAEYKNGFLSCRVLLAVSQCQFPHCEGIDKTTKSTLMFPAIYIYFLNLTSPMCQHF